MAPWKPQLDGEVDVSNLDLDAQEGFLLSRLDGATAVEDLPFLTGLPEDRVQGILDRLVSTGTIRPNAAAGESAVTGSESESDTGSDEALDTAPDEDLAFEDSPGDDEAADSDPGRDGNWRGLFERELRPLDEDARVGMARHVEHDRLQALCYDPSPKVISALLENQRFGLEQARLVATHHRTGAGLDALGRRSQFVRDRQVQRMLFRNAQTPQSLLARVLQSYRLAEIYRLTSSRESTDRVRSESKKRFRKKFPQSSAEERVQLILKTEGRCLPMLVGIALGGRAAALLCRRPLSSTLLIRNLARWPSTPPPVLQHMARQPAVKRSPVLRNEILRHPNAPSRLKSDLG